MFSFLTQVLWHTEEKKERKTHWQLRNTISFDRKLVHIDAMTQ